MKLEINKVVECIASISEDKFYLKSYAKEIIERYCDEQNTELLKQNEALVECLKEAKDLLEHSNSIYKEDCDLDVYYHKRKYELLNTLNK